LRRARRRADPRLCALHHARGLALKLGLNAALLWALGQTSMASAQTLPDPAPQGSEFQIAPYNAPLLPPFKTLQNGLSFSGHFDSEAVGVIAGGLRHQLASDALLQLGGSLDTAKAGLWPGGTLDFSLMGVKTNGNLPAQTGAVQTTSNDWAPNFLRLYQFSYAQDLGAGFVRAGIMDVNYYFASVGLAGQLLNASFGPVPTLTSNADIATFPYPGLGLMGGASLGDGYALQAGVWQANPPEFSGVLHAGALALVEASKSIGTLADGQPRQVFKLGLWHMRQNNPLLGSSTGGVYGIAQTRWDVADGPHYGAFLQLAASNGRVNVLPYYLGFGLRVQRPFAGRDDDSFSIGLARANLSSQPHPETVVEATYAYKLATGVYLQPDVQRILHAGGNGPPATVLGVRLHLEY
jgi:porin